jgi:hypothetical protein
LPCDTRYAGPLNGDRSTGVWVERQPPPGHAPAPAPEVTWNSSAGELTSTGPVPDHGVNTLRRVAAAHGRGGERRPGAPRIVRASVLRRAPPQGSVRSSDFGVVQLGGLRGWPLPPTSLAGGVFYGILTRGSAQLVVRDQRGRTVYSESALRPAPNRYCSGLNPASSDGSCAAQRRPDRPIFGGIRAHLTSPKTA